MLGDQPLSLIAIPLAKCSHDQLVLRLSLRLPLRHIQPAHKLDPRIDLFQRIQHLHIAGQCDQYLVKTLIQSDIIVDCAIAYHERAFCHS